MAHSAQQEFIKACLVRFKEIASKSINILEVGSQDINGGIRGFFPGASSKDWLGLDVGRGEGVDFCIPGELIQLPVGWADISFSSECFEHARNWKEVFLNMIRCTRAGGLVVLTFAGLGRAAHGTVDTEEASSPYTSDYYKNITVEALLSELEIPRYFTHFAFEVNSDSCDTYFWGIRNQSVDGSEWLSAEESLARARGQLGLVMTANRDLERQVLISNSPVLFIYNKLRKWRSLKVPQ